MCMQVVECCGKNPHLQVAIPASYSGGFHYTLCLHPEDRVLYRVQSPVPMPEFPV